MKRLNQILDHVSCHASDTVEMRSLKRRLELQSLKAYFRLSNDKLKEMSFFMLHEMHKGLEDEASSTLKMLPSYVYRKDVSEVSGSVYALDLGGTNFRVIRMDLHEGKVLRKTALKFKVPKSAMEGTNASDLFGFIADCIAKFQQVKGAGEANPDGSRAKVGFTFSFPTQQVDINKGSLINWTKGFTTKGIQGEDLVGLLQKEIDLRSLRMNVVALCNDTVGTLIAKYFADPQAEVGVILGTGSNACYWEKSAKVTKSEKCIKAGPNKQEVVINMEFGNFDSKDLLVLPRTPFDEEIDRHSPNPGSQRLEKMISGYYQGELVRLILVRLSKNRILPSQVAQRLTVRNEFQSESVSQILGDRLPGRHRTEEIMAAYGAPLPDLRHRYMVHEVCELVVQRAAQLAGMAIGATLLKAGKQHNATVAIDGSVYEYTPTFRQILSRSVHAVVGPDCDIRLQLQRDGSGFGAGFIAALQE